MNYKHIPDKIPDKYKSGYLEKILLSVTVEINRQIKNIKSNNKKPKAIYLGPACSQKFAYEQGDIPNSLDTRQAPKKYAGLPIHYHCDNLVGVYVSSQ